MTQFSNPRSVDQWATSWGEGNAHPSPIGQFVLKKIVSIEIRAKSRLSEFGDLDSARCLGGAVSVLTRRKKNESPSVLRFCIESENSDVRLAGKNSSFHCHMILRWLNAVPPRLNAHIPYFSNCFSMISIFPRRTGGLGAKRPPPRINSHAASRWPPSFDLTRFSSS